MPGTVRPIPEGYEGVRRTTAYREDLHVLVETPDGTMAASTIMWLDEANKTAEFEPVGTHPEAKVRLRSGDVGGVRGGECQQPRRGDGRHPLS